MRHVSVIAILSMLSWQAQAASPGQMAAMQSHMPLNGLRTSIANGPNGCAAQGYTTGSIPFAGVLNQESILPPFPVPGVDCPYGIEQGVTLTPAGTYFGGGTGAWSGSYGGASWSVSVSSGGVNGSGGAVLLSCTSGAAVLNAIDFTWWRIINSGCTSITMKNVKFACPSQWTSVGPGFSTSYVSTYSTDNATISISHFVMDNTQCVTGGTTDAMQFFLLNTYTAQQNNNMTVTYGRFYHVTDNAMQPACGALYFRYNGYDGAVIVSGGHQNWIQQSCNGVTVTSEDVSYNFYIQTALNGAEVFQFANAVAWQTGDLYAPGYPVVAYNVFIAKAYNGTAVTSNMLNSFYSAAGGQNAQIVQSASFHDNYADKRGGTYAGSNPAPDPAGFFRGWTTIYDWPCANVTFTNNVEMTYGPDNNPCH
jgi:hypothetical protein